MISQTNAAQSNALGQNDEYRFDAAGEVVEKIDADGRAITYSYDGIGRETRENWYASVNADGSPAGSPTDAANYVYDAAGRLRMAASPDAQYIYTYDAAGETTSEEQALYGFNPEIVLQSQYVSGNRTQLAASIGGVNDFVNNYQYQSALGQMSQVTQSGLTGGNAVAEKSATLAYDNLGEFSSITRYADLAQTQQVAQSAYGYDALGNLTSLVYSNSGSTLPNYSWTYDPLGNMATSAETLGSIVDSASYTSDSTGQLLTAAGSSPPETYSYDSNGNRTNTGYATGPNNELLSDGTYTYSYDGEGNQTARWIPGAANETAPGQNSGDTDITIYTWDNRDRLTSVTHYADYTAFTGETPSPDLTVTYTYDAFNRWIGETVQPAAQRRRPATSTTATRSSCSSTRRAAGTLAATDLSHRYLWGPAVDQLLADEQLRGRAAARRPPATDSGR